MVIHDDKYNTGCHAVIETTKMGFKLSVYDIDWAIGSSPFQSREVAQERAQAVFKVLAQHGGRHSSSLGWWWMDYTKTLQWHRQQEEIL